MTDRPPTARELWDRGHPMTLIAKILRWTVDRVARTRDMDKWPARTPAVVWTPERLATARPMYESGAKLTEIGDAIGLSKTTVHNRAVDDGWQRPDGFTRQGYRTPTSPPALALAAAKAIYVAGGRHSAVAEAMGRSPSSTSRVIRALGWKRPGDAPTTRGRRSTLTESAIAAARREYEAGSPMARVDVALGRADKTVARLAKAHGWVRPERERRHPKAKPAPKPRAKPTAAQRPPGPVVMARPAVDVSPTFSVEDFIRSRGVARCPAAGTAELREANERRERGKPVYLAREAR